MKNAWRMALATCGCVAVSGAAWAEGGSKKRSPARMGGSVEHGIMMERLDVNRDGKVTRQEARQAWQKLFSESDTNRDGIVTRQEAQKARDKHQAMRLRARFAKLDVNRDGRLTPSESRMKQQRFRLVDANADGAITRSEMRQAAERREQNREVRQGKSTAKPGPAAKGKGGKKVGAEPAKRTPFARMDANHDGKLTRVEARAAAEKRFQRLDANSDGVLSGKELKKMGPAERGERSSERAQRSGSRR